MTTSRRTLLKRFGLLGGAVLAGPGLLGCGGRSLSCDDETGLDEYGKQTRASTAYVDKSPRADERCRACRYFVPPSDAGCGSCELVRGPIHPEGWCRSFVERT